MEVKIQIKKYFKDIRTKGQGSQTDRKVEDCER